MTMTPPESLPRSLAVTRIAIALFQGAILFALYRQLQTKSWPATDGMIFAPLVMTAVYIPLIAITSLGNLRARTLTLWVSVAIALCVGLAGYGVFRSPTATFGSPQPHILPTFGLWVSVAAIIFIVHSLVAAGDADRKYIADYSRYHDTSWILGIRHVLAVLFVAMFWALLWLGAAMFELIKIDLFSEIIKKDWFFIPATTLALAGAIHLTDVRAGIVQGTRTLVLNLLSWLLPLIVLITAGFLFALFFTGLEPLWNTRRATSILLTAVAMIIILINTTYQDNNTAGTTAKILLQARLVAVVALTPLTVLAAYGLWLRVDQYGYSTSRISVIACVIVSACYAIGYLVSAFRSRFALRGLETTNIVAAFAIVGILLALLTPIADPTRIAVADQVRRLESGKTPPEKFDFAFLRFQGGRYGQQALESLKKKGGSPEAERLAFKANEALDWKTPYDATRNRVVARIPAATSTPRSRTENITVVSPAGGPLPPTFTAQEWSKMQQSYLLPPCLQNERGKCDAIVADIDGDDTPEVLLFGMPTGQAEAFKSEANGSWVFIGSIQNIVCTGAREALSAGKFELIMPTKKEIKVGDDILSIYKPCVPRR